MRATPFSSKGCQPHACSEGPASTSSTDTPGRGARHCISEGSADEWMQACHSIAYDVRRKQRIGMTCPQHLHVCELAEKVILVAAQKSLDAGGGYCSTGVFHDMEELFCHAQMPEYKRSAVGDANINRRACCMGLSSTRPKLGPVSLVVRYRSPELQALTRHVNAIIREAHPSLCFTSLQLTINGRAVMHTDTQNRGISVAVACGRSVGGHLFTMSSDNKPLLLDCAGKTQLFDGRLPHCNVPFAGYRLSAIGFVHSCVDELQQPERDKFMKLWVCATASICRDFTCDHTQCAAPCGCQSCVHRYVPLDP